MAKPDPSVEHRTAWHPLFVQTLITVLQRSCVVHGEYQLNQQPFRIDVVVVRKEDSTEPLPREMAPMSRCFALYTVIEFKGPHAQLSASSFRQLLAYGCIFCEVEGITDPRKVHLMTVSSRISPAFREAVRLHGGRLKEVAPGVYQGSGLPFTLYCIATEEAGDHVLQLFSPTFLRQPAMLFSSLTAAERTLFIQIFNQVEQFRHRSDAPLRFEDYNEVIMSLEEAIDQWMSNMDPERRVKGLTPEERLKGLPPEERLKGLPPEERVKELLKTLTSEELLQALPPEELDRLAEQLKNRRS